MKCGKKRIKKTKGQIIFDIMSYTIISLLALLCIVPLWLILSGSFSENKDILVHGFSFFPRVFSLEAYKSVFEYPKNILNSYKITIITTIGGTILNLIVCSSAGYVLSRRHFRPRRRISFFFFFPTIFSAGLVPTYILCVNLGFKGNPYLALILNGAFNYFYVIIFRSFMQELPDALEESAKIDGANDLTIFFRIILPLCKPVIATIALFAALAHWNEWYTAMLYCTDTSQYPLQYYLYTIVNASTALKQISAAANINMGQLPTETFKLAMTIVATGPVILVYPFVQKYFIKGMTVGAVKG